MVNGFTSLKKVDHRWRAPTSQVMHNAPFLRIMEYSLIDT